MSVEELERIKAYGEKLEAERLEAAKPPPPPAPVIEAQEYPVILVTDAGAFLNVPVIKKLRRDWQGDVGETLLRCGADVHSLEGGEFVRAEALMAAFDAGIFGRRAKGLLRILQIKGPGDIEPRLPWGVLRPGKEPFNAFSGKVYPEPLLEALAEASEKIMYGGLPQGGDPRGRSAQSLEDKVPFELGVRTDLVHEAHGRFLWICYLPREESPALDQAEKLSTESEE
jgi:hypothetical protein